MNKMILFSIIFFDILILLYLTTTLSISSHEANLLYGDFSFIQFIEQVFLETFGHTDLFLRLPMIIFHVLSIFLLYKISEKYITTQRNKLWHILVFILLPGVFSSALMVDNAGMIIFGLLLFIYIHQNFKLGYTYPLLIVFSLVDGGFVYLFISLVFFSYYKKNIIYLLFNISLLSISLFLYGIEAHGVPKGHFLDTIGLYSAIFTPVIFIYLFYVLYRRFLSKDIDLLWFIASVPLLISLLLSFRQSIYIEDFAPYFIMALPLAAQTFYTSYKVRLKMFRTKYKTIFILSFVFLLLNFFVVLFNRELYVFIENPKKHFARKLHIAKELSLELKKRDIHCVKTDSLLAKRLRFYEIASCDDILLYGVDLDSKRTDEDVTIRYKYRVIYKAIVTNINTQ